MVTIASDSVVSGNVSIGKGTYINGRSIIKTGERSKITIGENCSIAYNVTIRAKAKRGNNHKTVHEKDITIGNDVWIGQNALIREGVIIGDNAIVGANTVVTKNVPANMIAVGGNMRLLKKKS